MFIYNDSWGHLPGRLMAMEVDNLHGLILISCLECILAFVWNPEDLDLVCRAFLHLNCVSPYTVSQCTVNVKAIQTS